MVRNWNRSAWKSQAIAVLLCSMIGAIALTFPAVAHGEEEVDQLSALQLIRSGNDAFEAGDFETAYENYEAAHSVLPEPTIRYRMGQAAHEMGQIRDAMYHFEAYLDEGDDEERIATIEALLPELQARLPATLIITSVPEGAGIIISGQGEQGRTPGEYEVEPGKYRVTLRLRGYEDAVLEGEVVAEEEKSIEETMRAESGSRISTIPDEDSSSMAVWGYTAAGIGVALLAAGGSFSLLQYNATENVNEYNKRGQRSDRDELQGFKDDAYNYYRASTASYVAGGVFAAAGVGIIAYEMMQSPDSDTRNVRFEGGASPSGGIVGIRGRF